MPILDHSAPCSALHLMEDVGHTKQVKITLSVNGEVRQHGELTDLIWFVTEVVSSLSRLFELYPVDLIFTGTQVGVRQLNPGDRLEGEVNNLTKKIKLIAFLLKFHQNLSKIIIAIVRENYFNIFYVQAFTITFFNIAF